MGSRYARLAGWAAVLAPLTVIIHEGGHWLAGRLLGYRPMLGVGSVSGGAELGHAPDGHVAFQAGAGPAVTIILTLAALHLFRRDPERRWALALTAVAPLRFLVVMVSLGVSLVVAIIGGTRGTPNFDEYNFATALGLPALPLYLAVVTFLIWTWYRVWKGLPALRWLSLAMIVAGAAAGLLIWFSVIGPPLVALLR